MRLLYIDTFLISLNPTNSYASALFAGIGEAVLYGPGYVSSDILEQGIEKFIEATGPYDVLVLGPNFPTTSCNEDERIASARYAAQFTALAPRRETILGYYNDVLNNLTRVPISLKAAYLVTWDCYSVTPARVERIERLGLIVIAPNHLFAPRLDKLPEWARREGHFQKKINRLSNTWYEYLEKNPEKVITSLHFVVDSEISFRCVRERNRKISIPGVDYVRRREAGKILKKNRIQPNSRVIYSLYRIANKLGLPVYSNYIMLRNFNASFQSDLLTTKYIYTAPEGFGLPIRKYFEIPAAGAVLLCEPCNGFDEIGFQSGINCLQLGSPVDLVDSLNDLDRNPEVAQQLAMAGRNLVRANHTLRARQEQIKAAFEAILAGIYRGSSFKGGDFYIDYLG